MYKHIFRGVIPVDETVSVSYIEPFYSSQNFRCNDLLVPLAGASDVRPPVVPGLVQGLGSAARRARAAGRCWVWASLFRVAVMVTVAGCGSYGSSPGKGDGH